MKNAMKRIVCMMIAVMLLISAVPAAFAAGTVDVNFKTADGTVVHSTTHTLRGDDTCAQDLIDYVLNRAGVGMYEFDGTAKITQGEGTNGGKNAISLTADQRDIKAGHTVWIVVKAKAAEPIKLVVKAETSDNVIWKGEKTPSNGTSATVENLLTYTWNTEWDTKYTYSRAWSSNQQANLERTASVSSGDTLYIMLDEKDVDDKDDTTTGGNANNGYGDGNTYYFNYDKPNKGKTYTIKLHIFLNGNIAKADKVVTLNLGAEDDEFNMADAKAIVNARYDSTSKEGIDYDGLYIADGDWLGKFAQDTRYTYIRGLKNARSNQYIDIYMMINDAKAHTPDPSNPKTGDNITIAVTTMALAGAALVSVMELKKRKMI